MPIQHSPELLQPVLLAPYAVPRAHPRPLVHADTEKRVQRLPERRVVEVRVRHRVVRWVARGVQRRRLAR